MTIEELRRLKAEVQRQKEAVLNWMREEGAKGHLRQNSMAPAWRAYEEAEDALAKAIAEL